jgi:hypothetical protein
MHLAGDEVAVYEVRDHCLAIGQGEQDALLGVVRGSPSDPASPVDDQRGFVFSEDPGG